MSLPSVLPRSRGWAAKLGQDGETGEKPASVTHEDAPACGGRRCRGLFGSGPSPRPANTGGGECGLTLEDSAQGLFPDSTRETLRMRGSWECGNDQLTPKSAPNCSPAVAGRPAAGYFGSWAPYTRRSGSGQRLRCPRRPPADEARKDDGEVDISAWRGLREPRVWPS